MKTLHPFRLLLIALALAVPATAVTHAATPGASQHDVSAKRNKAFLKQQRKHQEKIQKQQKKAQKQWRKQHPQSH